MKAQTKIARYKLRKGDTVEVIRGVEKGKRGTIIRVMPERGRVVVEGVKLVKRHMRPSQKMPQGGIMEKPAPIAISNVMLVCPHCNKRTRPRMVFVRDNKARACRKCGELIDEV
jgi:large subunit ribosomal protein L24